jgi:hypothetical protein
VAHNALSFYSRSADQDFTNAVRDVARRQSVLFHGTSLGSLIARTDTMLYPTIGDPIISFTRSPETAVHFATLPKDFDDGFPTVFVFNRDALRTRYRIEPYQSIVPKGYTMGKFEAEERIWLRDIPQMSRYLSAIVFCVMGRVYSAKSMPEFQGYYKLMATVLAHANARAS